MGKSYHMVCHKLWYTTSHVQFLGKVKKSNIATQIAIIMLATVAFSLVMQLKSTTEVSNTLQTNLLYTPNKVVDQ